MKNHFQSLILSTLCALPTVAAADEVTTEELFRLHDCVPVHGQVTLDAEIVTADFSQAGTRATPLAQNAVMMRSPDAKTHLCFLYDAFGDLEVTAILTPAANRIAALK